MISKLVSLGVFPPIWKRLAANVASLVNGTTAQGLEVYNTRTSASVFERGFFRWVSNVLEIGTEHTGATLRLIRLVGQSVTIRCGGTDRVNFGSSAVNPSSDNAYALGSTSNRFTNLFLSGYSKQTAVAVASLPAAGTAGAGARHFVTDANAPTFGATVAGGGAVFTPVYSDGTNWKVG